MTIRNIALMAMQAVIVAFFVIGDVIDNWTEGRPIWAVAIGVACAFGATQAVYGIQKLGLKFRDSWSRNQRAK